MYKGKKSDQAVSSVWCLHLHGLNVDWLRYKPLFMHENTVSDHY